jgi:hypothetical protein
MELTTKKIVRYTTLGLALLLIAVLLFGSFSNSEVVTAVRIKLKAGQTEPQDKTFAIIGLGKEHSLPDYRVKLAVQGAFLKIDLGTKTDTSAAGGLEFPVQEVVPVRKLQEIVILECDTVEDDELERFQPGTSRVLSGKVYDCEVVTARSLDAGLDWFFNTSLGRTIASVCVLALLLFLVMLFSR